MPLLWLPSVIFSSRFRDVQRQPLEEIDAPQRRWYFAVPLIDIVCAARHGVVVADQDERPSCRAVNILNERGSADSFN
jgi:hypothetical protein